MVDSGRKAMLLGLLVAPAWQTLLSSSTRESAMDGYLFSSGNDARLTAILRVPRLLWPMSRTTFL